MESIRQIFNFLLSLFQNIGVLYTSSFILSAVLALWVFRKVVNYFKYLT